MGVFLAATAAACSGVGTETKLPELAVRLPSDFEQAQRLFDQRVKARFAVGTSEVTVKADVAAQGFRILPAATPSDFSMAVFERQRFPCLDRWTVRWRSARGKITELWGVYGLLCV